MVFVVVLSVRAWRGYQRWFAAFPWTVMLQPVFFGDEPFFLDSHIFVLRGLGPAHQPLRQFYRCMVGRVGFFGGVLCGRVRGFHWSSRCVLLRARLVQCLQLHMRKPLVAAFCHACVMSLLSIVVYAVSAPLDFPILGTIAFSWDL